LEAFDAGLYAKYAIKVERASFQNESNLGQVVSFQDGVRREQQDLKNLAKTKSDQYAHSIRNNYEHEFWIADQRQ
jgi:hypothetical protein